MAKKGFIKETGEEISDEQWKRFEAAVDVKKSEDGRRGETATDQPYRDEVEHPDQADGDKPAGEQQDVSKTTQRTE